MRKLNNTAIPREGLVLEILGDGNALDTSGNGNDGSATDVTYVDAERGYVGEVGSFNGSSSKIECGDVNISYGAITLSVWVKWNSLSSNWEIVRKQADNGKGIDIRGKDNIQFYLYVNGSWRLLELSNNGLSTNKWYQITAIYDGAEMRLYYNTQLVGTKTGLSGNIEQDTNSLSLGYDNVGDGFKLNGHIGLTRIYNRALNTSEIQALYQEGLRKLGPTNLLPSPNTKVRDGLVGEWNLDNNALDTSGNGNDGTPTDVVYNPVWGGGVGGFNGSSSNINMSISSISDFTISSWIKIDDVTKDYNTIITQKNESPNSIFEFRTNLNKMQYVLNNGTYNGVDGNITLEQGKRYHCIYEYIHSTGTRKGYINSVLDIEDVNSDYSGMTFNGNGTNIGTYDGQYRYFGGNIGLTKIYNRALSQQEINQLYKEGLKYIHGNSYSLPSLEQGKVLEISKPQDANNKYYDQSGNGQTGDATDVVDSTVGLNNVMSFNGDDVKFQIPNMITSEPNVSFITYIKITGTTGNNQSIFSDRETLGNLIYFYLNSSLELTLNYGDDDNSFSYPNALEVGKYYQIGFVKTGNSASIYINGIKVADGTTASYTSTANLVFGLPSATETAWDFNGQISNPKIYNRALSSTEVQALYYSTYIN